MNILTKRLLSALLALCMVLSTAVVLLSGTALVTYADDSTEEEDGEEEEDEGFKASDLITTEYATAEDKLRTMSKQTEVGKDKYGEPVYEYEPWKVYGNYELYVQELTGEVAIKDTSTGQILFTNPYDACTSVKKKLGVYDDSLLNQLFSQLKVTYEEVKGSSSAELYSYNDAALNDQIKVSHIKNGMAVEYTIGRTEDRRLVPVYMEKYRFEKYILSKIDSDSDQKLMRAYYGTHIFMNPWEEEEEILPSVLKKREETYEALAQYGPEPGRKLFVSEDYDPALESQYEELRKNPDRTDLDDNDTNLGIRGMCVPYTGRMSMYVFGSANGKLGEYEMNRIEAIVRAYAPEYTYDDLKYDHELTGYNKKQGVLPNFKMTLEYRLDEDGFTVRLPANSISFDEDTLRLTSIDILPYMGAGSQYTGTDTTAKHSGYTFIPDGSGTIIRFEDFVGKSTSFNSGTMYGLDNAYHSRPESYSGKDEQMSLPVYGIIETENRVYTKGESGKYEVACPHRWVEKSLEPDCVNGIDGGLYTYCAICGEEQGVKNRKAWQHNWTGAVTVEKEATCQSYRVITAVCQTCKDEYTKIKNQLSLENWTDAQIDEKYGYLKEYKSYEDVQYGYAKHSYERVATPGEDGLCHAVSQCKWCGELEPKSQEQTAEHEYVLVASASEFKDGVCHAVFECTQCKNRIEKIDEHCLEEDEDPTEYLLSDTVNHRCYYRGTCQVCGQTVERDVAHEMEEKVDSEGNQIYESAGDFCVTTTVCKHCGYEEKQYGNHAPADDNSSVLIADTATHRCYWKHTCRNCNATFEEEAEHTMKDGVCEKCGYRVPTEAGHTYQVAYVSVNGKCYRTFLCTDENCGKEYRNGAERVQVAHRYKSYVRNQCTSELDIYFMCEHCGLKAHEYTTPNESVKNHNFVWVVKEGETADCNVKYTKLHQCSECGLVQEEVVVDGHDYDNGKSVSPSVKKYTCTVCGHVHYGNLEAVAEEPAPEPAPSENGSASAPTDETSETPAEPEEEAKNVTVSSGFVAVMIEGASLATLKAASDNRHKYNMVYMIVTPRPKDSYTLKSASSTTSDSKWTVVSDRKYTGSYTTKYFMLQTVTGDVPEDVLLKNSEYDASYSGMANCYRDYLIESGILSKLKQEGSDIPLYLETFGTIPVSTTVLTMPVTQNKPLSTFEDLQKVLSKLGDESGIRNINIRLTGFTNGGMTSTMPYDVEFEKEVGGNSGFTQFVDFAEEKNVGVYPDFDFAYMHTDEWFDGYNDSDHAVKTIDGRYIVKKDYNSTLQTFSTTGLLAVSASVYDHFYTGFSENYSKFNNKGVSASTLGTDLNSDFDRDDPYNREDSRLFTETLLNKLKKEYGSVMVDGGNAYSLAYVEHILNMSLTGSSRLETSSSIPFMAMVLHGYINYAGSASNMASNMDQEILHMLENGASPYFIIATQNTRYLKENQRLSKYYSLDFDAWEEDLVSTYNTVNTVLKDVKYANFIEHNSISGVRVPDADEVLADRATIIAAAIANIQKYQTYQERYERALALYERKVNAGVADCEKELAELLAANGFDDATAAHSAAELSSEDLLKLEALSEKIAEHQQNADSIKATLNDNIRSAKFALDGFTPTYEANLKKYAIYFDLTGKDAEDPASYTEENYVGLISEKDGKILVATDGVTDVSGTTIASGYEVTVSDGTIVKSTYDNGISIYLNYNYYDVVVNVNGENIKIDAYGFYKTTEKGAD